jgi:tetratricopeptide (TPR) repeat protein
MGALPRPALDDGPMRALFDALHELHHRAGWPSLRDMSREVGCSHTTVSTAFSEPRLPRWGLVELIVEALGGDTEEFHRLWLAASRPASTPAPLVAVATQATPVPRDLPADVVGFTGRDKQLDELDELIDGSDHGGVRIGALSGTAGVGKTALAVHWAHRVADRFPDGQLYLNLRGYGPERPVQTGAALESLLRELGVDGAAIPQDVALRAARYRTMLAGRRMLVLLDNAQSVEQVRDLLPGDPSSFVLVTSRDALPALVARHGATRVSLDLLSERDSVTLLRTLIGPRVETEPAAATALAARSACLPLALRVVAELALSRPSAPLAELVAEFDAEARRLDLLEAGDDAYTAVRTVFSWSMTQLPEEVTTAFALLGLHPGLDIDLAAAGALFDTDPRSARRLLDALVRAHLVEARDGRRFGMHDLLRAYAAELAGDLPDDRQHDASRRMFDHYLKQAKDALGRPDHDAWLSAERPNLIAIALAAADHSPSYTIGFATTLARYLDERAFYTDALVLDERALAAAQAAGDRAGEAAVLNILGGVYRRLGRYREALPLHERSQVIHRELGDHAGEGVALHGLGILSFRAGQYTSARTQLGQALETYRELGDRVGEGHVLQVLGVVELKLGQHPAALEHLEQAVQINCEIGERTGEGRARNNVGEVYLRLGRLADADEQYRAALGIAREQGNRAGEGVALTNLATVAQRSGRLDEALDGHAQALAVCREVGYRIGQADALRGVGVVYGLMGRGDEAVEHLQMAIAIGHEIGEADVETLALNDLGDALTAIGQRADAVLAHREALQLAEQTGDRYEQARAHARISTLSHSADAKAARRHAEQARAASSELGLPAGHEFYPLEA